MKKTIIILDGTSEGKTQFIKFAKDNMYWLWNINHNNVLSVLTRKLCWGGKRDNHYYAFIEEFEKLCNKYWDFDYEYPIEMISNFLEDEKAFVLVIHNCRKENKDKLQELYPEICFSVFIAEDDNVNDDYSKTLNCKSDNYNDDILNVLSILTKE